MNINYIELPPLVGTLAEMPEHHRAVIESYGRACALVAISADRKRRGEPVKVPSDVQADAQIAHLLEVIEGLERFAEALTERVRELESKAQRVPLTESAIQQIGLDMPSLYHPGGLIEFARAIERAHGITED